ncbi:MAG: hypothetical protein ACJ8F4_02355 [Sphingomonas sp.]
MASNANGGHARAVPLRLVGWAVPAGLLTIPWVADWPWSAGDFIVAGAMFAIVGGTFELALRASGNVSYRAGVAIALAAGFLLVWINLAVGMIGSENNPLNLLFFGVIGAALTGSIIGRFKPAGMARAMIVAGALQGAIGICVFILDLGAGEPPGALGLLGLIEFFALMWLIAAWCFRRAERA